MQIFENDLTKFPRNDDSVVTVGTFDGLHLGHRELIARVVAAGSPSTVLTFYPHPQKIVARPGKELKILTPPDEKVKGFERLGVERLVVLEFNRDLLNMSAEEFLRKIVVEKIGLRKMVVGYDHAFGKDREGDKEFIRRQSRKLGFELEVVEPYYHNGIIVSSSTIRHALYEGDVVLANQLLGGRYSFDGWVIKGDCRGASLGYPTANLSVTPHIKMLPLDGVYAVYASVGENRMPALLYIGTRPTYGYGELMVEVFLLDFNGNLYGEKMRVKLVERLRGDQAFNSTKELVAQMKKDEAKGREILLKG